MNTEQIQALVDDWRAILASMDHVTDFALVGSAYYLPRAADVDFVVMLDCDCFVFASELTNYSGGWSHCGDYDAKDGLWCAVRSDDSKINLLLTHDRKFFDGCKLAAELSKALNHQTKAERILVCRIVRDGCSADVARQAAGLPTLQSTKRPSL